MRVVLGPRCKLGGVEGLKVLRFKKFSNYFKSHFVLRCVFGKLNVFATPSNINTPQGVECKTCFEAKNKIFKKQMKKNKKKFSSQTVETHLHHEEDGVAGNHDHYNVLKGSRHNNLRQNVYFYIFFYSLY